MLTFSSIEPTMAEPMKTPPTTYVALLRGVNVGGSNRLLMAELRAHFESLGCLDVRTFIQSGNVIFRSAKAVRFDHLEAEITSRFDIATPVVLRTAKQFSTAVRRNPFPDVDQSRLHLGFLRQAPTADAVARLELEQFMPDEAHIVEADVYLYLPSGMARNKLPTYVDRHLKASMTVRNWNTVTELHALTNA
jgi:uncharacterized protein (DUF1697 family)